MDAGTQRRREGSSTKEETTALQKRAVQRRAVQRRAVQRRAVQKRECLRLAQIDALPIEALFGRRRELEEGGEMRLVGRVDARAAADVC
jgi:hypothetical protein